ncbi:LptF/LptG family permease [Aestuariivirga litoralis]|uniref:LptF/LptG family permease n=1 Tax=Aestuariivirga litoralis TaxID=2650924 RepID=UPI0018C6B1F7|nr:LptF/LptG family permease [Aestuariivirga litoralis]MBG1230790.1 YjgP/YjgQ family permease [Aestuariivirga litoralis]
MARRRRKISGRGANWTMATYFAGRVSVLATGFLVTGVFILLMARLLIVFNLVVEGRAPWGQAIMLVVYFMPHYIGHILAFAIFFGVFETVRRMEQQGELVAMVQIGISPRGFLITPIILALVMSAIATVLLGWLEPWSRYDFRMTRGNIKLAASLELLQPGKFSPIGNSTVWVESFAKEPHTFNNVFIYGEDGDKWSVISAQKAQLQVGGSKAFLMVENGVKTTRVPDADTNIMVNSTFDQLQFDLLDLETGLRPIGADEQEFTIPELVVQADEPPAGTRASEMKAELSWKLGMIIAPVIFSIAAVGFGILLALRHSRLIWALALLFFLAGFHQLNAYGELISDGLHLDARLYVGILLAAFSVFGVLILRAGYARVGWEQARPVQRRRKRVKRRPVPVARRAA